MSKPAMNEYHLPDDSVVLSVTAEVSCGEGNAEFRPIIRLSGNFPKAFGERFIDAFSLRFTNYVLMINDEICSYSNSGSETP